MRGNTLSAAMPSHAQGLAKASIEFGYFDLLLLNCQAKLVESTRFDLTNPFFGHAHLGANFFERLWFVTMIEAESADYNFLLSFVKAFKNLPNLIFPLGLCPLQLQLVATGVLGRGKHLVVAGAKPIVLAMFAGNRAGIVLHDRPTGVGAEFVSAGEIKLLRRADERHIAVTHQFKKVIAAADVSFGDGNDEPQICANNLVFRRDRFVIVALDLVHQTALSPGWIERFSQFSGFVLQEIELSEDVLLLFARQQGHLIKAG